MLSFIRTFDIASLSFPLKFASISSKKSTPLSSISNSLIALKRASLSLLYSPELIVDIATPFRLNSTKSIPLESIFFFVKLIFALLKYKKSK